tara:strand:+ start:512 stop:712 length:201 start_codon:yes stop_codon:yes gene_type:complete
MSFSKTLVAANGAAAVTGTTGFMIWVADNAPALGIIFTGMMFIVSVIFYTLNYLERRRHHKKMEDK